MAYNDCMITMFRAIVNDLDGSTYTDLRINQLLNAAAFMVNGEIGSCSYVSAPSVSACIQDLVPDLPNYPAFANLVLLKALCMLDTGIARTKFTTEGIRAVCGPASLQVTGGSSGTAYAILFNFGPCAAYEKLKEDLCFRAPMQTAEYCKQILGPFVSAEFDPSSTGGGYDAGRAGN